MGLSKIPGCHLLWQMSFQWGSQKLLQGLVSQELTAYISVFNLFLTRWIMAILLNRRKPDNFKSHNSLKASFTNIQGLCYNFVEYESFLGSNSPEILALCEANLYDPIETTWTFLLGCLTVTLTALLFWIYLFLLTLIFNNGFPSIGIFWCCCLSFHWLSNKLADWDGLCDNLRDVSREDIFKFSASAASESCQWVQVGIDVHIPHFKYKVKPHQSPWFSATFASAIVHWNHFFLFAPRE